MTIHADERGHLRHRVSERCRRLRAGTLERLRDEALNAFGRLTIVAKESGTHSMRRTKVSLIYRRTKNLRAVQLLLGHSKLESTVRYLGIEVDDALVLPNKLTCNINGSFAD